MVQDLSHLLGTPRGAPQPPESCSMKVFILHCGALEWLPRKKLDKVKRIKWGFIKGLQ